MTPIPCACRPSPRSAIAEAREREAGEGSDAWLVADGDRRFVGRLRAGALAGARPGESVAGLLDRGAEAVGADLRLDGLLARVAAEGCIAVVDPDGRLIGGITSRDVVRALAARPDLHPTETPTIPKPAGAERLTGASQNSPSARSATKASTGSPTIALG